MTCVIYDNIIVEHDKYHAIKNFIRRLDDRCVGDAAMFRSNVFNAYPEQLRVMRLEALLDFTPLNDKVKTHLVRVYACLTLVMFMMVVGIVAEMYMHIAGVTTVVCALVCLLYIMFTPRNTTITRHAALAVFGFMDGVMYSRIATSIMEHDPELMQLAVAVTTAMFLFLSLAAMFSSTRTMMLTFMFTTELTVILIFTFLMHLIAPTDATNTALMVLFLIGSAVFILADTQIIIWRAAALEGRADYITDAITLFVDALRLFENILKVLSRSKKDKHC